MAVILKKNILALSEGRFLALGRKFGKFARAKETVRPLLPAGPCG
jgi:hypothetical protein